MCARFPRRFALVTAIVVLAAAAAVTVKATGGEAETAEGGELARPTILEHCEQSESPSDGSDGHLATCVAPYDYRNSTRAVERHFLLLLVGAHADPQRHRHLVPGEKRLQEALHGLRVIGCV